MAPGHYNPHSTNFGGLHTGTGKYQNGGPYANNGYQKKRISHSSFKEGDRVAYIGSNKRFLELIGHTKESSEGTVVSKYGSRGKSSRSLIRIIFKNGTVAYIHKTSLSKISALDKPIVSYKNKELVDKREKRRLKRERIQIRVKEEDAKEDKEAKEEKE